jgi:hypothetical protein
LRIFRLSAPILSISPHYFQDLPIEPKGHSIEMEDQPPPPYSVHDQNRSDPALVSLTSQNITAFRTIIPPHNINGSPAFAGNGGTSNGESSAYNASVPHYFSSMPAALTTSGFGSSVGPNNYDLEVSGFVSALPYFELRAHSGLRPADTNYQYVSWQHLIPD